MSAALLSRAIDPIPWLEDEVLASALTRFVSTLPYLSEPDDIVAAFREMMMPARAHLPWAFTPLLWTHHSPQLFATLLSQSLPLISQRFVAGNGIEGITQAMRKYQKRGFAVNLDILGEMVLSEKEVSTYTQAYYDLARTLSHEMPDWTMSFSCKASACFSQANVVAPDYAARRIAKRLEPVVEVVAGRGGHIYLDAEEYTRQEITLRAFLILYERFGSAVRFVLQGYMRNANRVLEQLAQASNPHSPVWVRLVRGAYWDYEHYTAQLNAWDRAPVFAKKEETDAQYEKVLRSGLKSGLKMVPATHNAETIRQAEEMGRVYRNEHTTPAIPEFQFLYGMGEPHGKLCVKKNMPVRFYMPVVYPQGDLTHAVAYLVRRLVENRSQMSFMVQNRGQKLERALATLQQIEKRKE